MNVSELLDAAIKEINRVLIGNKDRNTEEVYLKNAIRHIREYGSQPTLNENQQVVFEWLKYKYTITDIEPIELLWRFHVNSKNKYRERRAYRAYKSLTSQAQLEVLQVFSQWALEQEEE